MGIFGRDERTDVNKPAPAEPHARRDSVPPAGSGVTLIARGNSVDGRIEGAGEVRIEGRFKGVLDCTAAVVVAEGGEVEAELRGRTVTVAGRVRGNALATEKIELTPTADLHGDITAPRILIREGATFEGQVFMRDPGKQPETPPREQLTLEKEEATPPEGPEEE
jgi:cytoskeletal protein CcmA (bactofilin family)